MSSDVKIKCSECKAAFKRIYDLRKHVKKSHEGKIDEIAPLKRRDYKFSCDACKKNFTHRRNLAYHQRKHHAASYLKGGKKCPLCHFTHPLRAHICKHFRDVHDIEISSESLEFPTRTDFDMWKREIEKNTTACFVKERGENTYNSNTVVSYVCHRSGQYQPEGQHKRKLKAQGSRKIGGFCPSAMKVLVNADGKCVVEYTKTHVGHSQDLSHLNLTASEREEVAKKIAMQIPVREILRDVRANASEGSLQRFQMLTRKDLHNIAAAFKLELKPTQQSQNPDNSVTSLTEMKQKHFVLFHKPRNTISVDHLELKKEDFALIILSEEQSLILEQFSSNCVCLDTIHGSKAYSSYMHTLFVLDEMSQAFPAAFLFSNRSDREILSLFFSCLKKKIGFALTPNVFMSDLGNEGYDAWMGVMNQPEVR